ncbi:MAG: AmmeMemoRadiSam system radical SAM enzyme, partial [candidate division WOR-3 bacterium]|nr:AmmeMemoRadiSam system radical SAM enzyme [candidate division WOR-3 bacterium]
TISQANVEEVPYYEKTPSEIVEMAKKRNLKIICFTYTEPIVFYEYMYDISKLAKKEGIKTCVVSAGYINKAPLESLCKVVDAIKIDLKGFNEDFYNKVCGSSLQPILEALKTIKKNGIWLEIVNLIVPTLNDKEEEIRRMCQWIKENLGDEVPLHFTRFFPQYQLTHLPPTPISTLEKAYKIAKEVGLKYVYIGNVPSHPYENTYCPYCNKLLIKRLGFSVLENNIIQSKCKFCKKKIAGVF